MRAKVLQHNAHCMLLPTATAFLEWGAFPRFRRGTYSRMLRNKKLYQVLLDSGLVLLR